MVLPTFRPRAACVEDIRPAMALLSQDRDLFSPSIWRKIPSLLSELLRSRRAQSIIIEDTGTGEICFCGFAAMVRPAAIARILEKPVPLLRQSLFEEYAAGKPVFLARKQTAAANARGDLSLVHLFGCPDSKDFKQPRTFELIRLAFETFGFQHAGYQLREILQEAVVPEAIAFASTTGMPEVVRTALPAGASAHLFRFTIDDALPMPGHPMTQLMRYPKPRFGFGIREQELLEMALGDRSDREAAVALGLSEEAIKKRWRRIYTRVRAVPNLVPEEASGPSQRRALLAYMRQHLEELRPYRQVASPAD